MAQINRNLYELLFSCKGNWRNAIYIPCGLCPHPCKVDRSGYLAAIRQDGAPLLVSIRDFEKGTGERIDPGECIGTLSTDAFSSLFSRYLIWKMSRSKQLPHRFITLYPHSQTPETEKISCMKRINITCPVCGSSAYLRPASVVYNDKAPDPDAKYYVCARYHHLRIPG